MKNHRLAVFIASLVFLALAIIFCVLECAIIVNNAKSTAEPPSVEGEVQLVLLLIYGATLVIFWIFDLMAAIPALILSIISAFSKTRWIRIASIAAAAFALFAAALPMIVSRIIP